MTSAVEEVEALFLTEGDAAELKLALRHAERLDALEAENERLRTSLSAAVLRDFEAELQTWKERAERAEAALATARRDVERYRWLRNHPMLQQQAEIDVRQFEFPRATWEQIAYEKLDAAIDAALTDGEKEMTLTREQIDAALTDQALSDIEDEATEAANQYHGTWNGDAYYKTMRLGIYLALRGLEQNSAAQVNAVGGDSGLTGSVPASAEPSSPPQAKAEEAQNHRRGTVPSAAGGDTRSCTCHQDDNPPVPCPRKYALDECRKVAGVDTPIVDRHAWSENVGLVVEAGLAKDLERVGRLLYDACDHLGISKNTRLYAMGQWEELEKRKGRI